ncbi:MAG: hypothetical protein AAGF11_04860 [Myxococcota bacterium]
MPLGLTVAMTACQAEVEDGIFDPGVGGPAPGIPIDAMSTGPGESDTDDESGTDTDGATSDNEPTDETDGDFVDGDSTGLAALDTCPEAVGPGIYTCPEGSSFSSGDGWARCTFEDISLPTAPSLLPYCQYFDMGYLGFSWNLSDLAAHECPPEARYAPNTQTAYCLWEDIVLPSNRAEAECSGLVATGSFGFRWPCPDA